MEVRGLPLWNVDSVDCNRQEAVVGRIVVIESAPGTRRILGAFARMVELVICEGEAMRVRVYELKPSPDGFVLDEQRLHCVIDVNEEKGSFRFRDASREKLIRELFDGPCSVFVAGGKTPEGVFFDAVQTHPAWSVEAIEAIVKNERYGHNLAASIEYDA